MLRDQPFNYRYKCSIRTTIGKQGISNNCHLASLSMSDNWCLYSCKILSFSVIPFSDTSSCARYAIKAPNPTGFAPLDASEKASRHVFWIGLKVDNDAPSRRYACETIRLSSFKRSITKGE